MVVGFRALEHLVLHTHDNPVTKAICLPKAKGERFLFRVSDLISLRSDSAPACENLPPAHQIFGLSLGQHDADFLRIQTDELQSH